MTLREYRQSLNITMAMAAEASGMPMRTYCRYEKDENYGSIMKRKMIVNIIKEKYEINELHGILSVEYIRRTLADIFIKYGNSIEFCYLFGSYAKGYAKDESDVDLCISTALTGLDFVSLIGEVSSALKKKVDLIRLSDLKDNMDLIIEIMKVGERIYG